MGTPLGEMHAASFEKHRRAFRMQRWTAGRRGIKFYLTFEQWLSIWINSGHLHERGRRKDQYVMSRIGDVGPYAINNVAIILQLENSIAPHLGKPKSAVMRAKVAAANFGHTVSKETRAKIANAHRGHALSEEHKLTISQSLKGVSKSPEHRAKMTAANCARAGRIVSVETRAKISLARRNRVMVVV